MTARREEREREKRDAHATRHDEQPPLPQPTDRQKGNVGGGGEQWEQQDSRRVRERVTDRGAWPPRKGEKERAKREKKKVDCACGYRRRAGCRNFSQNPLSPAPQTRAKENWRRVEKRNKAIRLEKTTYSLGVPNKQCNCQPASPTAETIADVLCRKFSGIRKALQSKFPYSSNAREERGKSG